MIPLEISQILWFVILGLALFVWTLLDGFDLGAAMWSVKMKTEEHQSLAVHSYWPVWDGNALWGLIAGGSMFAIFPLVFGKILSGLYPYVMLLLLALIFRPLAFELWHHSGSKTLWLRILGGASLLTVLLPGAVLGNTVAGYDVTPEGWILGGLFSILGPYPLLTALSLTGLTLLHGAHWLKLKLPPEALTPVEKGFRPTAAAVFLLALGWVLWSGLVYLPDGRTYFWITSALFLLGLILQMFLSSRKNPNDLAGFWVSGATLGFFWVNMGILQFPNLIRATGGLPGLTIADSAPAATLSFLGIAAPLVLLGAAGYTVYIYRVFRGRVKAGALPSYK